MSSLLGPRVEFAPFVEVESKSPTLPMSVFFFFGGGGELSPNISGT